MALHLRRASLDWALTHVERHGDTDIFPVLFEFAAIRYCWNAGVGFGEIKSKGVGELLRAIDISSWSARPYRRCLSPKGTLGFRIATQLDPVDSILFAALIYEIGKDIEAARIPAEEQIVHSYRFAPAPNGDMFDTAYGYRTFMSSAVARAKLVRTQWIVQTDIADFYPRIYSHPLENLLSVSTVKSAHAKALLSFLSQIHQSVSYGLPIGPSPSRLLAELVLVDVDQLLKSEGIDFIRFVDDYRLFCRNEKSAYEALGLLADALFETHGLTLQQHKTKITAKGDYLTSVSPDEEDLERARLSAEFEEIIESLGLDNSYEPIDYDELGEDLKIRIDGLNLLGILLEQIELKDQANILTLKFVLRRLAQLGNSEALAKLSATPAAVQLVLKEFVDYVVALRIPNRGRARIGRKILSLTDEPKIGHLPINRAWILNAFARDETLNCSADFVSLLNKFSGQLERRELVQALGSHKSY